jgi:hypothetical protein
MEAPNPFALRTSKGALRATGEQPCFDKRSTNGE